MWSNYFGIGLRGAKCTMVGNTIKGDFGIGVGGTGIAIYVDGENAAIGDDSNIVSGNVITLSSGSIAVDAYDMSNLIINGNVITMEDATISPIRLQAPGTVGHATRDFISVHNNIVIGGALPIVNQVASADWGTNISLQTDRIDKVMSGSISFTALAVNFNSVADTQIPIILPNGYTRYKVNEIRLSGASHSLTTAQVGLFTAAAAGGAAIVAGGTAVTVSAIADATANNAQTIVPAAAATISYTATPLFFRVTTAEGAAATAAVEISITPLP